MTSGEPHEPASSILPHDWAQLVPLVDIVLEASPAARAACILELTAGNAERQSALEHLIAECERDMPFLDRPASERFDVLANEPEASLLPELVAERYEIGRELGRGGMACVYLARDRKHGRDVAIKVIRPELAASLGHDRFLREIEIAARLRHPNIVPLYDSGEVDGALYFVMPFEEGPSLRDRLRDHGRLPVTEALSVLRDVARALSYAHEHGVLHRDVKPDNVMLSGDAAVVTDFGIAKAVTAALTVEGPATITQVGSAIGTPTYMAPEQAVGDPATDHRADIYAFGCLAYEVFCGTPPFAEGTTHEIISSHMTKVPQAIAEVRPEVPVSASTLVALCLAKRPDDRPQSVRDVLASLDAVTIAANHQFPAVERARSGFLPLRWAGLIAAVIVLGATSYWVRKKPDVREAMTIAVIPFANSAADSTVSFVVDGLGDEVAENLTRVPGIQIKSRAGARIYRGQLSVDVAEAGARLKAAYIMTGLIRQDRGRWLLSTELARAADGASIWAKSFLINPDEQARAAATITNSLLDELRTQFAGSIGTTPPSRRPSYTLNNEASRFYGLGQEQLRRRGTSVKESAEFFRQAIREDPLFARAYSGLSMSLALFPYFQGVHVRDINNDVVKFANRALELDSTLAEPHIALGLTHQFALRWDSAGAEFRTAIQRDASNVEARVQYARHLLFRGRVAEGMSQLAIARAEDPASALVLSWVSYTHYLQGHTDSALVDSRRAFENDSNNLTTVVHGLLVRLRANERDDARAFSRRLPATHNIRGYGIAQLGDTADALLELSALEKESVQSPMSFTRRAYLHLGLGDTTRALDALERAIPAGEIWPSLYAFTDPIYAKLEKSKRWEKLLRQIGLLPQR